MREILFRGKRVDNGEWVNGWYCEACYGAWPLRPSIIPMEEARDGYYRPVEIDTATVGQYTGLMDKNGKKIWEGDIVSVPMALSFGERLEPMIGFIEWLNGAFSVTWKDSDYGRNFAGYLEDIEVVGNIYDNPDLLQN